MCHQTCVKTVKRCAGAMVCSLVEGRTYGGEACALKTLDSREVVAGPQRGEAHGISDWGPQ